ncbi:MAG: ABC transporter permease [Deltaproteobacteria bacterium]|nr:ABC transporter permease [Deltaproteobacteria bacterium]
MALEELRALWLVLRQEYVQRVKSPSFLVSTIAAPMLFLVLAATPVLFATPRLIYPKHIVIVCSAPEPARQIVDTFRHWELGHYRAEIVVAATPQEHDKLMAMVRESRIEGFLWLDKEAIVSGHVLYTSRSGLDSFGRESLNSVIYRALIRARLAIRGLRQDAINSSLQPVALDLVSPRDMAGRRGGGGAIAVIVVTVTIITILEMSLLSYGIIVMRSVLEDKTSRVVEILLCSVTPRALMAGKILGIGGLSLTQVAIWSAMAASGLTAAARMVGATLASSLALGPGALVMFALFYMLGYLLYSSLYAALGAAFNTADEAQYWSFILTLPLVFSGIAAWSLFEQADSAIAIGLSLVPPLAPVMMSMRIAVGAAASWQIGLSLALMAAAIYVSWALSAHIYRVGTLMYGKKPSLREIARWVRYA